MLAFQFESKPARLQVFSVQPKHVYWEKTWGLIYMVAIAKRLVSAHKISLLQREHFKATHDPLTGLINQIALDERIEHEISLGARYHKSFAILMLELNRFQSVAESFSKIAANNILIEFAKRLKSCVRTTDIVARFEGDIFVVLLPDVSNVRNVVKVIQSINAQLLTPFTVNNDNYMQDTSIGISLYPGDGETKKELIERAHIAMCQSRNDDAKNYSYYCPEVDDSVKRQIALEDKIQAAIDHQEYDIHYMSIQSAKNDALNFVQAEIVWHQSELREIDHRVINNSIESLELSKLFGDVILNSVCQQMAKWKNDKEYHGIPAFIQLTESQFNDHHLVNRFDTILKNNHVPPEKIGLIIRESFLLENLSNAIGQIKRLKQAGFKLIIDEFSCGLSYIGKFTDNLVDFVRLDSRMIAELDNQIEWLCVVEGVVRIAHQLNIDAIISGINNQHQYAIMQSINCDSWQGDYIYLVNDSPQFNLA